METKEDVIEITSHRKPDTPLLLYDKVFNGSYHGRLTIAINGNNLIQIQSLICGCGVMALHGLADLRSNNVSKPTFYKAMQLVCSEEAGVSIFIGTLGSYFYTEHEYILSLGFEQIEEYNNTVAGHKINEDTQRLYIYKLHNIKL